MRFSHLVSAILWFVPLALQAAIALVMLWRGLVKVFPVFFSYVALVTVRDVLLLLFPNTGNRYAIVFWWGDAAAILLSLGVIVETLWHLFRPYPFLRFVFRWFWVAAVIATASALTLLRTSSPSGTDRVLELIILMERSARVLQVCLLIVLISLMSRLGLTWQHYTLGITAGFGMYAALDLALLEFRARPHLVKYSAFALLGSGAYNLAVVIWALYFLGYRAKTPVESLPSNDLKKWNQALTEYADQWYRR
ncbi:MAG: hypothetical protein WB755_11605 [Terriglobales bacterium]